MRALKAVFISVVFWATVVSAATGDSCVTAEPIGINASDAVKLKYPWSYGRYYIYGFTALADAKIRVYSSGFSKDTDLKIRNSNCNGIYTDSSYNNDVSLTFNVSGGETYYFDFYNWENDQDEATVYVELIDVADPQARDDSFTTGVDQTLQDNLLSNDDGWDISASIATQATHGNVSIGSNGDFTYTPDTGYLGSDSFTYTVTDAFGNTDTATVTISVSEQVLNGDFREFSKRTSFFAYGDMVSIGNTFVVAPFDNDWQADCYTYTNGSYADPVSANNALRKLCHYNVDGNQGYAATSAELRIPRGAKILWAGLYWQALSNHRNDYSDLKIKIRRENSSYVELTADVVDYKSPYSDEVDGDGSSAGVNEADIYSAFVEVTDVFNNNGWSDGNYTVASEDILEGQETDFGVYGAWNLIVVYEDKNASYKSFSIFDGWKRVRCEQWNNNYSACQTPGDVLIEVSGFYTPRTLPINAKLAIFAAEGDYNINNDIFKAKKPDGTWYDFTNTNNPSETPQTFSSLVNTTGSREPSQQNNNGIDIQRFDIGTGTNADLLDTGQTSMQFRFTSNRDLYFPSVLAFSTEVYAPDFCYDYAYSQYGRYFTEDNNGSQDPRIRGIVNDSENVSVKVYIRNRVASDLVVENMKVSIEDINVSQAIYARDTTKLAKYNTLIPVLQPDNTLASVSDGYIRGIDIGTIGANEYFYLYFDLDPQTNTLDMPLRVKLTYDLVVDPSINPIPYELTIGSQIDMCTQSNFEYLPAKGIFNVVNENFATTTHPTGYYYNLPTQVTKRIGNFKILSLDPADLNTTKEVSTVVAVDMIDASAFHDTNASCMEINASISNRIWVVFENNVSAVSFNAASGVPVDFFKNARQNAAFRVSYNLYDDNGTLFEVVRSGTTYGVSNLTSEASACGCASSGMTKSDLDNCMECLYGQRTKMVCSRDNFSIRPEAFHIVLKDINATLSVTIPEGNVTQNIAAGYDYFIEVNATTHRDDTASSGYTKGYSAATVPSDIFGFAWNAPATGSYQTACNDTADKNMTLVLIDGREVNGSTVRIDQVGEYILRMIDKSWTVVDSNSAFMQHHLEDNFKKDSNDNIVPDCVLNNADVVAEGAAGLNGCEIRSSHHNYDITIGRNRKYYDYSLDVRPYSFGISSFTASMTENNIAIDTNDTHNNFVYIADINRSDTTGYPDLNMSFHLYGRVDALGKNMSVLSNFVANCYAKDIRITLGRSAYADANMTFRQGVETLDGNDSRIRLYFEDINNSKFNADIAASDFKKSFGGKVQVRLRYNFGRKIDRARNPQSIRFAQMQTGCVNLAECRSIADANTSFDPKGEKDVNETILFYYVKSYAPKTVITKKASDSVAAGDVNVTYEIYCYGSGCDKTLLPNGAKNSDDPRWWINPLHTSSYGTAGVIADQGKVAITTQPSGNAYDRIGVKYTGTKFPYRQTVKMPSDRWLIYNKYDASATTNDFIVEFHSDKGGWTGSGESTVHTKTKTGRKNRQLSW